MPCQIYYAHKDIICEFHASLMIAGETIDFSDSKRDHVIVALRCFRAHRIHAKP